MPFRRSSLRRWGPKSRSARGSSRGRRAWTNRSTLVPRVLTNQVGGRTATKSISSSGHVLTATVVGSLTSGVAGILAPGYQLSNGLVASSAWVDKIAPGYDQFLVESFSVSYVPNDRYSKVTLVTSAFAAAYDPDDGVIGSYTQNQLMERDNGKILSLDDPFEVTYTVPGATAADGSPQWLDVATPSTFLGVWYNTNPLPVGAAATFGVLTFRFRVRVRATR